LIKQNLIKATLIAAVFMLLPLPVMQYIGEESWYTLSAYEMYIHHNWWHQTLMGSDLSKTPLFNWLVIAVTYLTGWDHLEIAPRLVSVFSTWGSAFVVFKMAGRFFPDHANAGWLGALIYLTMGDVFFWYGWLGYADGTFGFFIFSAVCCLWLAIEDEKPSSFIAALSLISVAFMIKNISCYAIFGLAGLVLIQRYHRWHLLMKPSFMLPGILALSLPWLYQSLFIQAGSNTEGAILHAALNFKGFGLIDYIYHWISYPALFLARAFPVSLLLIWFFWREKQRYTMDSNLLTLLWLLLVCLAPFWLSAGGSPRYLVPFYGLLALLITGLTLQLDHEKLKTVFKIVLIIIILKIPYSFAVLPYVKDWRPERDIKAVAEEILQITNGKPLRTRNDVSTGLSIGAYINVRTPPEQFFRWYDGKEKHVYILSEAENPEFGELIKHWRLQGNHTYLYWKP